MSTHPVCTSASCPEGLFQASHTEVRSNHKGPSFSVCLFVSFFLLIEVYLIYNVLVSRVQQSDSDIYLSIYIYIFTKDLLNQNCKPAREPWKIIIRRYSLQWFHIFLNLLIVPTYFGFKKPMILCNPDFQMC